MNALARHIARLIQMQGPLSIAQYMAIALHDPAHGYYSARQPIGAAGDFITAPEISQMFGELLGAWIVQAWRDQGSPSPARLVELGPGRGTFMADVLRAANLDPKFLRSIELVLIETSATLREAQTEKLKTAPVAVRWTQRFDDSMADRPLFLLANEFFDALPIRQYVFTARGWCERMVGVDSTDALAFVLSPVAMTPEVPAKRATPKLGDIYENCRTGEGLVEQVATVVAQKGGAALIVDYGYKATAGFGETLQAVAEHSFASVLDSPGEADLSAHVDFAALSAAAERSGARTCGPAAQGAFLKRLGIDIRAEQLSRSHPDQADSIAAGLERLTSPERMGQLFKALAIVPPSAPRPPGF
jgi:NADH dehydrogenase [ubiquinone] 1 alpha subcomplex assembly factor 7